MRLVPSVIAALALASAPIALPAVTLAEKQEPYPVEFTQLNQQPQAYEGMRVRFTCTFVQTAALFDPFHTPFTPERYLNLVVWDDQARIWEPEVRAQPITTLYYSKLREGAQAIGSLPPYVHMEVVGQVVSSFRGYAWIECHEIIPLTDEGAFTENAIYHLQQAVGHTDANDYALADENYRAALADNLPLSGRVAVMELQAHSLMLAGHNTAAAEVLATAIETIENTPELDRAILPSVHYMRAKTLAELAEQSEDPAAAAPLFEASVVHARRAIELDPTEGDTYAVLGIGLAGLEAFDEARIQCERAIRMQPDNAEIRWYLGRILDLQGDYDLAIETLKRGIDLAPKDYRLHKAVARAYHHRAAAGGPTAVDDLITSLREYDISIRLEATDADLFFESGVVLADAAEAGIAVRVGKDMVPATHAMAISRWQQCLAVDDTYVDAHLHLARRFRVEERHDESHPHFHSALALVPDDRDLVTEVTEYHWSLEQRDQAYEIWAEWQSRNSDDLEAVFLLGRLSLELARLSEDSDAAAELYARSAVWGDQLISASREHLLGHADLAESRLELGDARVAVGHATAALAGLEDEAEILRVNRFLGLAQSLLDEQDEVEVALTGRVEGSEDERLALALGWALSRNADNAAQVQELANQALALGANDAAKELLGWGKYLAGDYAGAETVLRGVTFSDEALAAYRLGMAIFQQGPERYDEVEPLLEIAEDVAREPSYLSDAQRHVDRAQDAIRDYRREVERQRREAERQAERERRAAERAARDAERQAERERREAARRAEEEAEAAAEAAEANAE